MNKYLLDYFYHITIGNIILIFYLFLLPTISIKDNSSIYNIFLSIEIIFVILILLNYLLIIFSSKKLSYKLNKIIILYNYIYFPFFIMFSFSITYLFQLFKYNNNTLYFYLFLFLIIIFSYIFTKFELTKNNDKYFLKYKFITTFDIIDFGVNKNHEVDNKKMNEIKIIRKLSIISYFLLSYIILLFIFILNFKNFKDIWIYVFFILLFTLIFIFLIITLLIKNKRCKVLNLKYFLINISILVFVSFVWIILFLVFKNNLIINNIGDSIFYSFIIIVISIITKTFIYGIYPYQIEYLKFYSKDNNT